MDGLFVIHVNVCVKNGNCDGKIHCSDNDYIRRVCNGTGFITCPATFEDLKKGGILKEF